MADEKHIHTPAQGAAMSEADAEVIWSAVAFLRAIPPSPNDIAGNNRRADDSFRIAASLEKIAKGAAQPPAAPGETGRHVSCAPGGKPYADSHNSSSAGRETELLATLVYEAMRFAIWAAGQGIMPDEGEPAQGPEDFLYEYSCALEIDDWEGLAEVARDHIRAVPQTSAWQPIETAPKDGSTIMVGGTGSAGWFVSDVQWNDGWMMWSPEEDEYTVETHAVSHWMPIPRPPSSVSRPHGGRE